MAGDDGHVHELSVCVQRFSKASLPSGWEVPTLPSRTVVGCSWGWSGGGGACVRCSRCSCRTDTCKPETRVSSAPRRSSTLEILLSSVPERLESCCVMAASAWRWQRQMVRLHQRMNETIKSQADAPDRRSEAAAAGTAVTLTTERVRSDQRDHLRPHPRRSGDCRRSS
jgi:hypothetical protein